MPEIKQSLAEWNAEQEHIKANEDVPSRVMRMANEMLTSAQSSLVNRREHPSYGYTKSSIASSLDKAEAIIAVWQVLAGRANHVHAPLDPQLTATKRLLELRADLKQS